MTKLLCNDLYMQTQIIFLPPAIFRTTRLTCGNILKKCYPLKENVINLVILLYCYFVYIMGVIFIRKVIIRYILNKRDHIEFKSHINQFMRISESLTLNLFDKTTFSQHLIV